MASETLEVTLAAEFIEQRQVYDNGVPAIAGRLLLPRRRFYGEPGDGQVDADGATIDLSIEFAVTDNWHFRNNFV